MLATQLLEMQNRDIERAFESLGGLPADVRPLLTDLANRLIAHMTIEEEIFYPAIRHLDPQAVASGYEEHALLDIALRRLLDLSRGENTFHSNLARFRELFDQHVKEEEEDLFPRVEVELGAARLERLSAEMKARFDEVLERGVATWIAWLPRRNRSVSSGRDGVRHKPRRARVSARLRTSAA